MKPKKADKAKDEERSDRHIDATFTPLPLVKLPKASGQFNADGFKKK